MVNLLESDKIDIDTNRRLINRYRFIKHESMHILAGWLPKTPRFELKCEEGRAIWEDAQHVNALYLRLREIQSPAFQKPSDAALIRLMEEMLHAPNEYALALAFWKVVKPALIKALKQHATTTFPNTDLPSVYAIEHIVLDETAQAQRMKKLFADWKPEADEVAAAAKWVRYIKALLAHAGGITGDEKRREKAPRAPSVRRQFAEPREVARDSRFTRLAGDIGERAGEDEYDAHTVMEFERYSTEMLAAETVALVMFQLPNMPWEFQHDSARHLYDEVRHCLIGFDWMHRKGLNPFATAQFTQVFKWRSRFSPLDQYTMLTMGNEVNAFPYRHRRIAAHEKSQDHYSEQQVRYDVADETQHVRFGKRWLPEMHQASGDKRPLDKYIEDILQIWETEYKTGKLTIE